MLKEILTARTRPSDKALYNIWARKISGGWTETTITGTLPLAFLSEKVQTLTDYRIYGTAEGAGAETESGEPAGYKLTLTVTSGEQSDTYPLYIGDSKLGEEEYVDYGEQKVYKLKEAHKDTVTIDGVVWDILGYDHDTVYKSDNTLAQHSVTIQTHDCVSALQFDAVEALFAFPNGLAAGTYYFTIDSTYDTPHNNYEGYQFTTTQDIPNKGLITFPWGGNENASGVKVSTWASSSATTPLETLTTSNETSGTFLGQATLAIDTANNINAIQRARYGSNKWGTSALKQLLNSDKAAGTFWKAQTVFDRAPSWAADTAGFLYGMNPDFVSVLGRVKKRTALNTVSDGGGYEDSVEKVFLLSRSEVYAGKENNIDEGSPYDYFKDFSDFSAPSTGKDTNRIKYRNGTAKYWWLRSPDTGYAFNMRLIFPSGELNSYYYATGSFDVAPACCIVLDDINTNPYLQSLFLKPTDPTVSLPPIPTYKGANTLSSTETVGSVSITGKIKEAT